MSYRCYEGWLGKAFIRVPCRIYRELGLLVPTRNPEP